MISILFSPKVAASFSSTLTGVHFLKKIALSILVLQTFFMGATAQSVITGTVRDSKGESLSGVSIHLKGGRTATTSGSGGNYSINVPTNGVLLFTYVGHAEKEVPVNNQRSIDVILEESNNSLDALVVVGYGTVRRKDLTGAVSSVSRDEINAFPSANVMQALTGRAAGVQVKQNTGAPG
ncbi:MAG: carboxypeptidase-like regulatory domain-containing protein, partial [Chitinophagaceae bacterium]